MNASNPRRNGSVPSVRRRRHPAFTLNRRRNQLTGALRAFVRSVGVLARQYLDQAVVENRDRFVHVAFIDHQRRHEAHRTLPA